jgi:F-type H+-transporting ATPase subunit delta
MAENITLARPYAEAAFKLACNGNAPGNHLPAWKDALDRMALVAADPAMRRLIANPKLSPAQLAQLFLDVTGKLGETQRNFVRVLVDNERLALLPEIRDAFAQLKNGHDGVRDAHITSAFPLDEAALKKLVAELEPRFNCKLNASVNVDPELIGGVKIAVGDEVIDASVRGKLAAMATALKN